MDFTREPVIESVITPREGCKLVVRSSKSAGQEEYFVDAVEIVSFGSAQFFRSLEKPKCFLLPVVDYEILEVREARMVLKHVASERPIKIGKSDEKEPERAKEPKKESQQQPPKEKRGDKKRERKRHLRRRKGKGEGEGEDEIADEELKPAIELAAPQEDVADVDSPAKKRQSASSIIRSLLSPPPLIQETIGEYRTKYSQAFYESEEEEAEEPSLSLSEESSSSEEENEEVHASADEEKKSEDLWNFTDEV